MRTCGALALRSPSSWIDSLAKAAAAPLSHLPEATALLSVPDGSSGSDPRRDSDLLKHASSGVRGVKSRS
eukprot:4767532-Pleurochrysis_carterae.AAC.1